MQAKKRSKTGDSTLEVFMRHPKRWFALSCLAGLGWMGNTISPALGHSGALLPGPHAASWLAGFWSNRIQFTVRPDSIEGTGSLQDFPVLLRLGAPQGTVFTRANTNGSDLLITKADGKTVLGHEVVSFNRTNKTAEIWFKADTLSKSVNKLYLYYGNPSATAFPPAGAAWNSKYLAVYHFSENPGLGVLKDWGPRGNNGNAHASGSNWTP